MMISDGFLWNFEDVINFASRIYFPKISLKDWTDFEWKNTINLGSYGIWLIFHYRNETFCWKKIKKMSIIKKRLRKFFVILRVFTVTFTDNFFEKVTKQEKCHFRHCIQHTNSSGLNLRGGSTRLEITWVQQRQHHRAQESARERMLSLALTMKKFQLEANFNSQSHARTILNDSDANFHFFLTFSHRRYWSTKNIPLHR